MTLLGLLHCLWTEAGFNAWAPSMNGKRSLGLVHYHLLHVASSTFAGRVRLSSNLVIAATAADGQHAGLNKAKSTEAMNRRRRRGCDTVFPLNFLKRKMMTVFVIFMVVFVVTVGYATVAKTRAAWILVPTEAQIGFGYFGYTLLLSKL